MRRNRAAGALIAAALVIASCTTPGQVQQIEPGERPAIETDEAGMWMVMDRVEQDIKTSGSLVRDADLNAYVRDVFCSVGPQYCADVRIYVVRAADFNASMAPNGVMIVWTGIILRAQNEAQLATVLGHELSHYVDRHALQRWRDMRNTSDDLVFFNLATGPIGGLVAAIVATDSIMSFSRDQERDADSDGLALLRTSGYEPREAAKIWEQLIEEKDASDEPKKSTFFSTHPDAEERAETLAKLAAEIDATGTTVGRERHAAMVKRFRGEWLLDELRQRDYARFEVLLNQLAAAEAGAGAEDGELLFYRGEMHRLRGKDDDNEKAIAAYEGAAKAGNAPAEAYRSLGLLHRAANHTAEARTAFETYLNARQDAEDRAMIEHYLQQMQ